jgi:hypothetical protein
MERLFVEEQQSDISKLMLTLESLPVARGTSDAKYSLYKLKK